MKQYKAPEKENTSSEEKHSSSKNFSPASIAWLRITAGKVDVSYEHTRVSSKSRTICNCPMSDVESRKEGTMGTKE